tara:strand:- start:311 stop:478 length:168 start_codon:yes stop_codon:yes gene_type:complete
MPKACVQRKIKMGRTMEQAMKECYPKGMESGKNKNSMKPMKQVKQMKPMKSKMGY